VGVSEAVGVDRRTALAALRDKLAVDIDEAGVQYVAPLVRQLQSVLAEIDRLPNDAEVNPVDELKAKRTKRRSAAANKSRAKAGDVVGS
jgi:hypothetical protein